MNHYRVFDPVAPPSLPAGPFDVVLSDPPWWYNARRNKSRFGCGARGYYPPMRTRDICALPVGDLTADNCALCLWTTGPRQTDAHEVISAWGFTFCTILFCWVKTNSDGSPRFGTGSYTGSNVELCLLARRGRIAPLRVARNVPQVILAPIQEHSQKPECTRLRIEALFGGPLRRLEMFARDERTGWAPWGHLVEEVA